MWYRKQWGHEAGDEVLRTVAENFRRHLRATDVAARLGGDEFALIFPEATADTARLAIDMARALLLASMQAGGWPVTCSIGAVTFAAAQLEVNAMVHIADELMYQVKRSGKNAVAHVCHTGTASAT